ncbi:endonuclease/exonuclease/phosphatase family protein [Herbiconiux ginsengi]|uniref:Metal-dependent hydrolase, endonuclease/exonuclease/phosphatase family n=1 Tax=Herbiconiux ginsengi TaxID=381665 RepID=A0A1H3PMF4_9MICO|nr:endonuclease/exonuclease/phosphatase family protein [Herbiconiux ginsengi]SDZ02075.1 Metal-dependent hydrolase, endonuclease/exonuclease/phosphatase family [Herbiconiux ginsengi]
MKIVSLNLRGFFDWAERMPHIVRYLLDEQPDLVMLQEVVYLPGVSPHTQLHQLNAVLGYPYRHASVSRLQSSPEGPYREGLGVLSRHPVTQSETLILLHEEGDPHNRIVQFFDVDVGAGVVWPFANVHLSVRDDHAFHQLEEVLAILRARGEDRIIGGDFNINHLERRARLWRDDYYVLTTEIEHYVSFAASNQADDYFLVPKEFTVRSLAVSPDGLSDHRALLVEITPGRPS